VDAMILAAGLGTRLGEMTRGMPKALVDVAGQTALERVARRLIDAGADRLIINVHHYADQIVQHVRSSGGFGVDVLFSREEDAPLETGGGLLHAAPLFRRDAPFLLHNVDVLSTIDLYALIAAHAAGGAVATLAVHERSSRRLLRVRGGRIIGRAEAGGDVSSDDVADDRLLAFAGIHIISPTLFELITERGAFSIMDAYVRLIGEGHTISAHDVTGAAWHEIGNPTRLQAARDALAHEAERD
jgi:N-acetyl-alpha-D-muramate 1-phosphate uridylyltransferase